MAERNMTDVISLLCDILNSLVKSDLLKAEYFKAAKRDTADRNVILAFWKVLGIFANSSAHTNLTRSVKLYFAGRNYRCLQFYGLPADFSSGSKELLLALSWLIGEKHIIELLVRDELATSKMNQEFCSLANQCSQEVALNVSGLSTLDDYKKSVLLLAGKINSHIKTAAECNEKLAELLIKIHKETRDICYLSVAEMNYVKNVESLETYTNEIESISNLLLNYSKWKSKETHYWNWMLSVMKSAKTNKYLNTDNLELFYNYLRCQVKQRLLKNKRENIETAVTNKHNVPRCIYFANDIPKDAHAVINDKSNDYLEQEEIKNVKNIYQYLNNFLYADA